jgi:hypothetical protein
MYPVTAVDLATMFLLLLVSKALVTRVRAMQFVEAVQISTSVT